MSGGDDQWSDLKGLDAEGISRVVKEKKVFLRSIDGSIRDLQ